MLDARDIHLGAWYCGLSAVYIAEVEPSAPCGSPHLIAKAVCQHKWRLFNSESRYNQYRVAKQVGERQSRVATQEHCVAAQIQGSKPLRHSSSSSPRTCLESRLLWNQQQASDKRTPPDHRTNHLHRHNPHHLLLPSIYHNTLPTLTNHRNIIFSARRGISISATKTQHVAETRSHNQSLVLAHTNQSPEVVGLMANGTKLATEHI